jgi:hypothetical protein
MKIIANVTPIDMKKENAPSPKTHRTLRKISSVLGHKENIKWNSFSSQAI